jgi:serine protease inhibitor
MLAAVRYTHFDVCHLFYKRNIVKEIIIFLFITSLLTACGSEQAKVSQSATTKDNPVTLNETESVSFGSSKTRVISIVDEQDREQWVEYINLSSINKFSDASSTRNFFTTPYHEISLFTLLALGTEGESLAEIKDYLDFELPFFDVQSEFFLSAVNSFDLALKSSAQGSAFSSSYVLFGQNDYPFSSEFLDKTVMYFGAKLQEADFINDPQDVLTQYT